MKRSSSSETSAPYMVSARWTSRLTEPGWTPIAEPFMNHYGELGITTGEFVFLVHLMSYKWDSKMPYPGFTTIARKMNITDTSVRKYARDLENRGFIKRCPRPGRTTAFDLTPLFQKLEKLMDDKEKAQVMHG